MATVKIGYLKPNEDNPRKITRAKMEKLKNSIQDFEKMLAIRPIIADENKVILGGNMRYQALVSLGYETLDKKWFKIVKGLTPEEKQEFIAKDNIGYGEWDLEALQDWDLNTLSDWGLEVDKKQDPAEGEVEFSEYLNEENNYVVLLFNDSVDWLQAQTHFGLKTVVSKRANGKPWSRGVGRVIDGAKYLKRLNDEH